MKSLPRPAAAAALVVSSFMGSAEAQSPYGSPTVLPQANQPQARFYEASYPHTNMPSVIDGWPAESNGMVAGRPRTMSPIQSAKPAQKHHVPAQKRAYTPHQHMRPAPTVKSHTKASTKAHQRGSCGNAGCTEPGCGGPPIGAGWAGSLGSRLGGCWFGGAYGLIMTRDQEDHYMFSFDTANESIQLTDSRDADMGWAGGVDVRIGKYLDCGRLGWEAVYWGVYPDSDISVTTPDGLGGNLNGILNWDQLDYNGVSADTWVDNAQAHALFRETEIHNVEFNFLKFGNYGCDVVHFNWLGGFRYFNFRDDLMFGSDTVNRQFTNAVEEIYYDIDVENHLYGVQLGGEGEICLSDRWNLDFGFKMGIFANHVQHTSEIGGAAGRAVINNGPNLGREWFVDSDKNDIAMLGELNLGVEYCLNDCWTLTAGYRAVGVVGVALPTNQIYPDLRGIQDVQLVDSNGSLILHGGYMGAEFCY